MKTILMMPLFFLMGINCSLFAGKSMEAPTLESREVHFAFVLLEKNELPIEANILSSFKKYSQGNHQLTVSTEEPQKPETDKSVASMALEIEGVGIAFIGLLPHPVPNGEAEANFKFSVSSYSEGSKLKDHQAHLLVSLMLSHPEKPLDNMMAFTSLLAALTEATPSVGVYWGNSSATHTRDFLLSVAEDHDIGSRILLWNGFSIAGESEDRMSYLSYGMNQIGLPDLYLVCDADDANQFFGRFFDLLSYVAVRGKAIPAGDTVGSTDEERIQVEYVHSPADAQDIVWKVEF
ncbi:MAG: DUF4261 domain-containing protein [Verrucomicrobiota bacterium]